MKNHPVFKVVKNRCRKSTRSIAAEILSATYSSELGIGPKHIGHLGIQWAPSTNPYTKKPLENGEFMELTTRTMGVYLVDYIMMVNDG
jgi:hypothetical protein